MQDIANEFDQCIKCGLCLAACPVGKTLFLEKYTPRGKIQLAKQYARNTLEISNHYRDIFAGCLLCGACATACPSGVGLTDVFLEMRAEIVRHKGPHPKVEAVLQSLDQERNISGEDNTDRGEWRDDMETLPEDGYEKDNADIVYFVGCVASFFPMVQGIPQNFVKILEKAGADFAVMAGKEWCCGYPLIASGHPEEAEALMAHNLEQIAHMGASKVVFSCPSCYHTWKTHEPAGLELFHSTQFINQLVQNGDLTLKTINRTVTFHDPCDLGRNSGVFDAPREVLSAIPGLSLVELPNNRNQSICCGGGGNLEMTDPDLSGTIAGKKIDEIQCTGANTVVTACQQCVRTIKGTARKQKRDLNVVDITDLIIESISDV